MKIQTSDIFKETSGILVHGCNCQGRFNSGFAKQVRKHYPQAYLSYYYAVDDSACDLDLLGHTDICEITPTLYVHNAFVQRYYGKTPGVRYVDYDAIESVFLTANHWALEYKLPIIFPKISAGLGGGNWKDIEAIINATVDNDVETILFVLDKE